tara:strand:+ start:365 stop:1315 length:951 start_codon:yes stop_codon:yes gene_type:complete
MSKEIVETVCELSNQGILVGLIPSRRQVTYDGGYVNNWNTDEFVKFVRSKTKATLIVRDHGGPLQGKTPDDGLCEYASDLRSGFNVIHIDPWKSVTSFDEGIEKTLEQILFCLNIDKNVVFEVGTEEAIFSYDHQQLRKLLWHLKKNLGDSFKNVMYAVVQSGVRIMGTRNIGIFSKDRLEKMMDVVNDFGLRGKEHNGDYLNDCQIKTRVESGLQCLNVAPELGVIQTRIIMKNDKFDFDAAAEICFREKKYEKWLPSDFSNLALSEKQRLIVELSGHYHFTERPFAKVIEASKEEIKSALRNRIVGITNCWEQV